MSGKWAAKNKAWMGCRGMVGDGVAAPHHPVGSKYVGITLVQNWQALAEG